MKYDTTLLSAEALALSIKMHPKFTLHTHRNSGLFRYFSRRMIHGSHYPDAAMKELYNSLKSVTLKQLKVRFEGQQLIAEPFKCLIPKYLLNPNTELEKFCKSLVNIYNTDLTCSKFTSEIRNFAVELSSQSSQIPEGIVRPRDVLDYLIKTDGILMYPEVVKGLLLYLTLPCTTASAERSFSKLKLIKSYLRTAMSDTRLNSLAILSIEKNESMKIDIKNVVNVFTSRNAFRRQFLIDRILG